MHVPFRIANATSRPTLPIPGLIRWRSHRFSIQPIKQITAIRECVNKSSLATFIHKKTRATENARRIIRRDRRGVRVCVCVSARDRIECIIFNVFRSSLVNSEHNRATTSVEKMRVALKRQQTLVTATVMEEGGRKRGGGGGCSQAQRLASSRESTTKFKAFEGIFDCTPSPLFGSPQ